MCNAYQIGPDASRLQLDWVAQVVALLDAPRLIRKTDPAPVVIAGDEARLMRWGFWRPFNHALNNTRADKLLSPMWADAFHHRRCLIPMSAFYEWSPAPPGRRAPKQAHECRDPQGNYLWMAGIWENHPDFGPCFSMITTEASPVMAPLHSRMPAILPPQRAREFLANAGDPQPWPFQPFPGPLDIQPCPSPLAQKTRQPDPQQQQLL